MGDMTVHVLHRYHDTPDNEGNDILGAYYNSAVARRDMTADAAKTKARYPDDFWTGDMTWETDDEIHLCHNPIDASPATVYCWEIVGKTVM